MSSRFRMSPKSNTSILATLLAALVSVVVHEAHGGSAPFTVVCPVSTGTTAVSPPVLLPLPPI